MFPVVNFLNCVVTEVLFSDVLLIPTVKKFENWSIFDKVIRRTKSVPNVLGHPVCLTQNSESAQITDLQLQVHAEHQLGRDPNAVER